MEAATIYRKATLATAIGLVLGGVSLQAGASLRSSTTLDFTMGVTGCDDGTSLPCNPSVYTVSDIIGSCFTMDTNGNGIEKSEKTPMGSFNGIHINSTQAAGGSHAGGVNGTEHPSIDAPWTFFGATGMHQTTSPITATSVTTNGATLDMSGWNWTWYGIPGIPLLQHGAATMSCTPGSSCSDSSSYTLDAAFHVNSGGFTTVSYTSHLEATCPPYRCQLRPGFLALVWSG